MAILELAFIVGLGGLVSLLLINATKENQQQRQLTDAFYQLLETQNGYISLIQLAVAAKVDAQLARQYLEHQAKAFAAVPEVDADGDTFYRFPKLHPADSP
jgi:Fic family protein